jgi:hypothetical protein
MTTPSRYEQLKRQARHLLLKGDLERYLRVLRMIGQAPARA